jgi:hypothetical protein
MKRVFSSKDKRKQAEEQIMRDMRKINKNLAEYRKNGMEPVSREKTMQTLTEFLQLKRQSKMH